MQNPDRRKSPFITTWEVTITATVNLTVIWRCFYFGILKISLIGYFILSQLPVGKVMITPSTDINLAVENFNQLENNMLLNKKEKSSRHSLQALKCLHFHGIVMCWPKNTLQCVSASSLHQEVKQQYVLQNSFFFFN